jgi:hypothetical protein
MRFLVSLFAGLALVGVAPVAASQAAAVSYSASSAAPSSPAAKATFGAGPANTKRLDGRPYFTYDTTPGGSIEDHIAVINFANHPQTLSVYAVDATSAPTGAFAYPPRSAPRRQVGAWLFIPTPHGSGELTLAPHSTVIVPFYLRVPSNASPGDHAGAVIVSLTSLVKGKSGQRVKFEQRIATRVIIRVSGPLRPRLSIENLHASYSGSLNPFATGVVTVTYTVDNTGNLLLGAAQQVSAHGWFGSTARAPALPVVPLLLPGGSYPVTVRVHGVFPEIGLSATVRLTPEGLRGDVNPGLHLITASVHLWAVPWILVAIVIVLVFAVVALIWRRRRRSRAGVRARASASKTPEGVKP